MNRIGKREFYSNPSKYIKPGIFILTSHGKDELKVIVTNIDGNVTNNTSNDTNNEPNVTNNNNNVTNNSNVTNIHQQKVTTSPKVTNMVTTSPSKAERIETAKKIGLKPANEIPAPKEVTKEYPGIKTQADYEGMQARQKEKEDRQAHYGCGCKKTESLGLEVDPKTKLCPKHERR